MIKRGICATLDVSKGRVLIICDEAWWWGVGGQRRPILEWRNYWRALSGEFWEIFKNIYFKEHLQAAASVYWSSRNFWKITASGGKLLAIFTKKSRQIGMLLRKFYKSLHKPLITSFLRFQICVIKQWTQGF